MNQIAFQVAAEIPIPEVPMEKLAVPADGAAEAPTPAVLRVES